MTAETQMLRALLKRQEGFRARPYLCSAGKLTIGHGRNLEGTGITEREAEYLLDNDILRVSGECHKAFPWFTALNSARQAVIISMGFMGIEKLKGFVKMSAALDCRDYGMAAREIRDSLYAKQVGERAEELAQMMETGFFK